MEDWEYSDKHCPKCGQQLAERRCDSIYCDDGEINDDSDPEWPETGKCDDCNGTGWQVWCRGCGWDVTEGCFLNPQYEVEWLAKQQTGGIQ